MLGEMNKKQIDKMSFDELRFALAMGLKDELYKYALKRYLKLKAQKQENRAELEALRRSTKALADLWKSVKRPAEGVG